MTVLEPGEEPVDVVVEESSVVVPVALPVASASKAICASCRRPGIELDRGWVHLDAQIDHPSNPAWCLFELWEEPKIRWGYLNDGRRPDFTVTDGRGSKGSGGLAA